MIATLRVLLMALALQDDVDALLKKLGSEAQEERDAASRELIRRGRPVREAVERKARDADPEIAGRARAIIEAIDFGPDAALEVAIRTAAEEKESHQRFLWKMDRWLQKAVAGRSWDELLASFERQKILVVEIWERESVVTYRFLVRKDAVATPQGQTLDLFIEFEVKRVSSPRERTLRVIQKSKAGLLASVRRPLKAVLSSPVFPADGAIQKVLAHADVQQEGLPDVDTIEITYGPIHDRRSETIPWGFHVRVTCVDHVEARIRTFTRSFSVASGLDPERMRDGSETAPGAFVPRDIVAGIRPWGGSGSCTSAGWHGLQRLDLTTSRRTSFWMGYSKELVPEAWSAPDLAALPDTVRTLRVRGTHLTTEELQALTRFRGLEKIHLCENDFGEGVIAILSQLPALSFLCLRAGGINDQGVARLRELSTLTELELSSASKLTDQGLAEIGTLKKLRRLEIRGCRQVTDKGLHALAGLENLEELDFWLSAAITDEGLAGLARLPRLRFAELSDLKSVTPAGWAALAKAPSLRELYFNYCALDDDGLAELGKIKDLEFLAYYQHQQTGKITDQGLLHLKGLANLRRLHIYSKPVTAEGMKALEDQLPGRWVRY
jgi:hypothetical protein